MESSLGSKRSARYACRKFPGKNQVFFEERVFEIFPMPNRAYEFVQLDVFTRTPLTGIYLLTVSRRPANSRS